MSNENPSQIVSDRAGNFIYFIEHGGNRISKIDIKSGIMTEYDIPTGPLSTAVFLAVSDNGEKVWFTEYTSNKIAYLDTTAPVPLEMQIILNQNQNIDNSQGMTTSRSNDSVIPSLVLKPSEERIFDVVLKTDKINSDNKRSNNTLNNITSLSTLSEPLPLL